MQSTYDYRKFAVLYVDDEETALRLFKHALGDRFRILTATNARAGLQVLRDHQDEIGLLMTDQRMPGEKGVWLLEQARQLHPRITRILLTAYTEIEDAIAAVNTGGIYQYVVKTGDVPQLEMILKRGLELFMAQKERDELLQEKNSLLQKVLMAERVASLGFLAAGMSHFICNWLVAVKTFVDRALELRLENVNMEALKDPDFWKLHQLAQGQIKRIEDLINELRFASETGQASFADRVNLREIITAAVEKLAARLKEKAIEIENEIPASLPLLIVDRPQFIRLFELLLKDEIESLPEGSRITLSAEVVSRGTSGQTEIHVSVRDNGPCLPQQTLRRLFNFFASRSDSPAESGINLMLCYFIVLRHGGNIEVTSEPNQGTTFHLYFSADPDSAASGPKAA